METTTLSLTSQGEMLPPSPHSSDLPGGLSGAVPCPACAAPMFPRRGQWACPRCGRSLCVGCEAEALDLASGLHDD
jgi:hypothetical protein